MFTSDYTFYRHGFFGYGDSGAFDYFSFCHILPIAFLLVSIVLIWSLRNKIRHWKYERTFRFWVAFIMILVDMSYYWRVLYVGSGDEALHSLITLLPLQLCEWTCICAAFMLMSRNRKLYAICYFFCLTIGWIPLFMPAVLADTGPGYFRYYQYFLEHILPIAAVFYMMFVHRYLPRKKDLIYPIIFLTVLAILAIVANKHIAGANFLYLSAGTVGDSPANFLPENIWIRGSIYAAVLLLLFAIAALPVALYRKKRAEDDSMRRQTKHPAQ